MTGGFTHSPSQHPPGQAGHCHSPSAAGREDLCLPAPWSQGPCSPAWLHCSLTEPGVKEEVLIMWVQLFHYIEIDGDMPIYLVIGMGMIGRWQSRVRTLVASFLQGLIWLYREFSRLRWSCLQVTYTYVNVCMCYIIDILNSKGYCTTIYICMSWVDLHSVFLAREW